MIEDMKKVGLEDVSDAPDEKALTVVEAREKTVRDKFWTKFKSVMGSLPFARDLLAVYYCAMDSGTPLRVRATLLGALVYFIMPLDVLPDFIALLGFTDDATVLFAVIRTMQANLKPEHYEKADDALSAAQDEKDAEQT